MPVSAARVNLAEVLEVRDQGLTEAELWSVLCATCEALQDVCLKGEYLVWGEEKGGEGWGKGGEKNKRERKMKEEDEKGRLRRADNNEDAQTDFWLIALWLQFIWEETLFVTWVKGRSICPLNFYVHCIREKAFLRNTDTFKIQQFFSIAQAAEQWRQLQVFSYLSRCDRHFQG